MTFTSLNAGQIAFLIIVPLIALVAIGVFLYFPIRNKKMKTNFRYFYYKKLYSIAMDRDYYLINNFLFKIDSAHVGRIDHILFGDKYIYICTDCYFEGNIDGKEADLSFVLYKKDGTKVYEDNVISANRKLIEKLCLITGLDQSLMIGICIFNDDCRCSVQTNTKSSYMIQRGRLKALVRAIESRDIGEINKDQLASAVKAIDKLNRRKRKGGQK